MTTSPNPLNPSSSPERREQTEAFLEWWAKGAAVSIYGSSWYDIGLAAWLAACDWRSSLGHARPDDACTPRHPKHSAADCPHNLMSDPCSCFPEP